MIIPSPECHTPSTLLIQESTTGPLQWAASAEEYFRALTENGSDVIAILDPEGRFSYVSPSVERTLRYSPAELIGSSHFDLIHPEDRDRAVAAFERLGSAAGSTPVSSAAYRCRRKDGAWRTLESVGTNLLDHPQVRGLVLSARDITDRKLLEQELEQLHRLTSLGRLAAQVAHEFNNVLMGVQPVAEVIRRHGGGNPHLLRFADLVDASIRRGKRITTDILRFGRPAQLTVHPVEVQDLIHQVTEEIRPMLPEGIDLHVNTAETPMYVSADRAQLAQVLINLMLNARDAMHAKGTLTIEVPSTQRRDDCQRFIHFTVADTGDGIAGEDLPHIFEPLFTTKKSGSGLGLSVVFQIVAAHGGHISVDSESGKGSTFHIFIPAVDPVVQEKREDSPKTTDLPQALRILLVEDDETVACGLKWLLEAEGIEVRVVRRGADVSPAVSRLRPDLIMLDLGLPDDDGGKVYERIAAECPLPVIFSSGHALENEIEKLLDNPGAAFLMKPYSPEDLLRTIHLLIDPKETRDERNVALLVDPDPASIAEPPAELTPFEPAGELPTLL
jgi:PAS domain S-box-containing protein